MVRSAAELGGAGFAIGGGFLAEAEGDGDEVDDVAPLV